MAIDLLITKLTMLLDAPGGTEYKLGLKTALRLANEAKLSASQNASTSESALPISDVVKSCLTTEIVERRMSGKEVVKYRAPYGSDEALQMIDDIDGCSSYFYRHV